MRGIISILSAVAMFASFDFGQTSHCPKVVVSGPTRIPPPGENFRYDVRIEPAEKAVGLSYLWTVYSANREAGMVRGQGTTQIEVPFTYDNVTASVTIIGLPEGCPSTASETVSFDAGPVAIKLNEITGSLTKAPDALFASIRRQMREQPDAQLFVSISSGKSGTVVGKTTILEKRLALKANRLDGRSKIVRSDRRNDTITFWIVPQGAEYPFP